MSGKPLLDRETYVDRDLTRWGKGKKRPPMISRGSCLAAILWRRRPIDPRIVPQRSAERRRPATYVGYFALIGWVAGFGAGVVIGYLS